MSSKKKRAGAGMVQVKNDDGTTTMVSQGAFGFAQHLGGEINKGDMSSMDKKELMDGINNAITGSHTNYVGGIPGREGTMFGGGTAVESSMQDMVKIQAEIGDAVAGTKPKYRYRKYLDQVANLQNDQPGQLQTVLSRGGVGKLGGV